MTRKYESALRGGGVIKRKQCNNKGGNGKGCFLEAEISNKEKERDRDREVLGTETPQTRIKGEKEDWGRRQG